MKDIFKYNRRAAIVTLVLVVIITVFADANLALVSEKKDVTNAYKDGSLSSAALKCADEADLMLAAAENAGYSVSGSSKDDVEKLRSLSSSPTGLENAMAKVYTDVIAVYEQGNDASVKKHFDSLGQVLDTLASDSRYNKKAEDYNDTQSGILCRLISPWFEKAADFTSLYDRFRTNFGLPSEPSSSDDSSIGDWISDHWFLTLVVILGLAVVAKVEKK